MAPERILVVGGPGTGKTTLARELGRRTGLPVHSLDDVARVGGGSGPERHADERGRMVEAIIASRRWIAEGVHLGWTAPLIDAADLIVWLDHVSWRRSSVNIVRRFCGQAIGEMRSRRGRERFLRVRDYARQLRELTKALPETRAYGAGGQTAAASAAVTRAEIAAALLAHQSKLHWCRTRADVLAMLETLEVGQSPSKASAAT